MIRLSLTTSCVEKETQQRGVNADTYLNYRPIGGEVQKFSYTRFLFLTDSQYPDSENSNYSKNHKANQNKPSPGGLRSLH